LQFWKLFYQLYQALTERVILRRNLHDPVDQPSLRFGQCLLAFGQPAQESVEIGRLNVEALGNDQAVLWTRF